MARSFPNAYCAMGVWLTVALVFAPLISSRAWGQQVRTQQRLDSGSDHGELSIVAAKVQLLLIAPDGKKTGYDPRSRRKSRMIPNSAYHEDALLAYDTGAVDLNTTQTITLRHPQAGKYRLTVSAGTAADGEEYEVRIRLYRQDGSEARNVRIAGTAKRNKSATYELLVSLDPASVAIVGRASQAAPTP